MEEFFTNLNALLGRLYPIVQTTLTGLAIFSATVAILIMVIALAKTATQQHLDKEPTSEVGKTIAYGLGNQTLIGFGVMAGISIVAVLVKFGVWAAKILNEIFGWLPTPP